ncbi:helix-turn-helix domain-containing protein [Desnuesiella massiliensis]|uniref:helix-turn-helix domain-containing protein n=1 Tax=Desnuesiella massiliensis TaxID=1650662 RepID=UPI0006E40EDC|nr:helix-turn-helix domain-containing protein [Desnuesiella massiliensis]
MTWVDKVQEAIEYIEVNLLNEITIESVGKAINYAPSSFQNLFSAITGYSIGEYIRFRRLACATDDLSEGNLSITDIAFKYRYENIESFSRAFKRLYNCSPSNFKKDNTDYLKFNPIVINFVLRGGFSMAKNYIPNLLKVDWSDTQRQNEFVNSVVSALNALGEKVDYDYVCALSGSAFRTSFSMPSISKWNHGNYHVIHAPIIIEHTFKMLGYKVSHHIRSDYEIDKRLIMDSIDKGVPVITLEGIINCSDACVVSGYDNDGDVLLGYNPFMYVSEDHDEANDDTGYFRKSNWHNGFFEEGSKGRILIIEGKCKKPSKEKAFTETLNLIKHLITDENIAPGQYNGLAAHKAFANALLTYTWEDNFEPYLNVMCNYKQYLDRQYAIKFFNDNGREDLAQYYEKIAALSNRLAQQIPQDFSASDLFNDKENLKPYCDVLLQICDLEKQAVELMNKN